MYGITQSKQICIRKPVKTEYICRKTSFVCRSELLKILEMGSERAVAELAAAVIATDRQSFDTMLGFCFTEKYPVSMRAARAIQLCCEKDAGFLLPQIETVIPRALAYPVEGVKRSFLKLLGEGIGLYQLEDPGFLADACFRLLADPGQKPAIRIYSMNILLRLAATEPELGRELEEVIRFRDEGEAPSFRICAARTLKALEALSQGKLHG